MKLSLLIVLALVTPLIAIERSGADVDDPREPPVVPGVLLVRYRDGLEPSVIASTLDQLAAHPFEAPPSILRAQECEVEPAGTRGRA